MIKNDIYAHAGRIKYFLFLAGLFFITVFITILITDQVALHSRINQFHFPAADIFFTYFSYLGDGMFAALLIIAGWFYNKDFAWRLLLAFLVTSLLVWVLKNFLFPGFSRPLGVFEKEGLPLHLVKDVTVHKLHSFPSGHSTTAFMIFTALASVSKKAYLQLLFAIVAILVAFSRVYLSQHFMEDILAGGILGTVTTFIVFIPSLRLSPFRSSPKAGRP